MIQFDEAEAEVLREALDLARDNHQKAVASNSYLRQKKLAEYYKQKDQQCELLIEKINTCLREAHEHDVKMREVLAR